MKWQPVIGLEVHVELMTRTKMFCRCPNDPFDLPPNAAVCPTCLGLPGALPVTNAAAVDLGLRAALALGCDVARVCRFERKSYNYPDLLKGFQITQYEEPLGRGGRVVLYGEDGEQRTVPLRRLHLEEDTAKLLHDEGTSKIDANRSGVPLLEIVSEPVIHSANDAELALRQLRNVLVHNGVSRCRLARGEMRLEANVSVRPRGTRELRPRVEIKNQSSFRFVRDAVAFEVERQVALYEKGEDVRQETRGWDPVQRRTFVQRAKEDAHDYRYFPEPDLPALRIAEEQVEAVRAAMPPSLDDFAGNLLAEGISARDVRAMMQNGTLPFLSDVRRRAPEHGALALKWLMRDVFALLKAEKTPLAESGLTAEAFAEVLEMIDAGELTATAGADVLAELFREGGRPAEIVEKRGLGRVDDVRAVEEAVGVVLEERADLVAQFRAGKTAVRNALFGAVMGRLAGRAAPALVGEVLDRHLAV